MGSGSVIDKAENNVKSWRDLGERREGNCTRLEPESREGLRALCEWERAKSTVQCIEGFEVRVGKGELAWDKENFNREVAAMLTENTHLGWKG